MNNIISYQRESLGLIMDSLREDPQDKSNELEMEALQEAKASEEYMELRAEEVIDYGPDDRHSNE